jgi:hypothetical protein
MWGSESVRPCECEVMWMWGDVNVRWCECEAMWMWGNVNVRWCECEVMWNDVNVKWCDCEVMWMWGDRWCECEVRWITNNRNSEFVFETSFDKPWSIWKSCNVVGLCESTSSRRAQKCLEPAWWWNKPVAYASAVTAQVKFKARHGRNHATQGWYHRLWT